MSSEYMRVYINIYVRACKYVYVHVYIHIYSDIHMCMCSCASFSRVYSLYLICTTTDRYSKINPCIHTYIEIYAYIHACIPVYVYVYIDVPTCLVKVFLWYFCSWSKRYTLIMHYNWSVFHVKKSIQTHTYACECKCIRMYALYVYIYAYAYNILITCCSWFGISRWADKGR